MQMFYLMKSLKSNHWKLEVGIYQKNKPNNMIEYRRKENKAYSCVAQIIKFCGHIDFTIIKVVCAKEVESDFWVSEIWKRLNVFQATLSGHEYILVDSQLTPIAYRTLPAWSLGKSKPTYLLNPTSSVAAPPLNTESLMNMEID
ncbi:hypothetical protein O181_041264 [Austropuccinia psidii MF-1]|uniref:Uncharacterized protein n=1 Tax=Austropuccinia psidii MF-1 TaxID=1389203 RepID=A0A9Q3HGB4_9BASI|nr:hypothetical protein [Austropuccinia psidii MF-1]